VHQYIAASLLAAPELEETLLYAGRGGQTRVSVAQYRAVDKRFTALPLAKDEDVDLGMSGWIVLQRAGKCIKIGFRA
jgi:hypothetical protein